MVFWFRGSHVEACRADFCFPSIGIRLLTRGLGTSISPPSKEPAPAVHASGTQNRSSSRHGRFDLHRAIAALRRWSSRHGRRRLGPRRSVFSAWRSQHVNPDHRRAWHCVFCSKHGPDDDDAWRTPARLAPCSGRAAGRTRHAGCPSWFAVAWTGCAGRARYNATAGSSGGSATSRRSGDALSPSEKQAPLSS
jgi:hypothetical protein